MGTVLKYFHINFRFNFTHNIACSMKLSKYATLSLALCGHGALALSREDFAVHHSTMIDRHLLGGHEAASGPEAAPDEAWNPPEGAAYQPHGMGIYHYRAHDMALHHMCEVTDENGFCLDFKQSRGSCYYAGSDPHIGHAIYCDVSEVECCGYENCASKEDDNRGKKPDGEKHNYYYYAAGYMSEDRSSGKNLCCHCMAGCEMDQEGPENVFTRADPPELVGVCTYYDVSHKDCQRSDTGSDSRDNPDKESYSDDPNAIGFLRCSLPGATPGGAHPPASLGKPMIRSQSAAGMGDDAPTMAMGDDAPTEAMGDDAPTEAMGDDAPTMAAKMNSADESKFGDESIGAVAKSTVAFFMSAVAVLVAY